MRIHVGCEMTYEFPQPTPVIAMLNVHASRFLIAYGRDAADVPLTLTFGANTLTGFRVTTEEAPLLS